MIWFYSFIMKHLTIFSLIFLIVVFLVYIPLHADAALTESQIQAILSLLKSFGADQTAIVNVESNLRGISPATPNLGPSSNVCNFLRDLTVGSSGADVKCLQNYLM